MLAIVVICFLAASSDIFLDHENLLLTLRLLSLRGALLFAAIQRKNNDEAFLLTLNNSIILFGEARINKLREKSSSAGAPALERLLRRRRYRRPAGRAVGCASSCRNRAARP